jgi:drug/metabolite transporter (DMT)-like permease
MAIALPFFLVAVWFTSRGKPSLDARTWMQLAGFGFVGYYLSSIINFSGLQYISVGLERIVLFTYPSIVIFLGLLFRKSSWNRKFILPLLIAYGGICLAYMGEAHGSGNLLTTAKGVGLVFSSAITYAVFILFSAPLIHKVGALRFTSIAVSFSALFVLLHYAVVSQPSVLLDLHPAVYGNGFILAIIGTVIPAFLMGLGLKRAGPVRFAVIGTIGPVGTLFLAWIILGEALNFGQIVGFILSLSGGLAITLMRTRER